MKKFTFGINLVLPVFFLGVLIIYAVSPFNLMDMKQAERIAKWKSVYEQLNYCFSAAFMHGNPISDAAGYEDDTAAKIVFSKMFPYMNFKAERPSIYKKYKYRFKNGRFVSKNSRFYFDKFIESKSGELISFKKNTKNYGDGTGPLFYMFTDINGRAEPNRIGEDIFFTAVFGDKTAALGYDKDYSKLKQNCSPIGSGLYCSEFYLLGGRF